MIDEKVCDYQRITILGMRGKFPEEARPLIKEYCDLSSVLNGRLAYDEGVVFEITEADCFYTGWSDEQLYERANEVFKLIILKYGQYGSDESL